MAYTRRRGSHARVTIDGTDVSNAFRTFRFTSEDAEDPVGGFSAGGKEEFADGTRTEGFTGQAFYTEEFYQLAYPLYRDRETFEVTYQPYGLVDSTREVYYGNGKFTRWEAPEEFGTHALVDVAIRPADSTGFVANDIT